jgi:hypothetical protein
MCLDLKTILLESNSPTLFLSQSLLEFDTTRYLIQRFVKSVKKENMQIPQKMKIKGCIYKINIIFTGEQI